MAFDLAWKSIKTFLEARGISCNSPISCFREAYREGVIGLEDVWIDMVKTRNKTAYVYNEILAEETFGELPRILEALKQHVPEARFYQASTSELFGQVREVPQSESTPFYPRSPYGVAKLYAYWIVVNYREAYGLYACNGILFNHESPRRGESFVSRKITLAATKIASGFQDRLLLGNLDAKRDWGYARDFVEGMWLMLQQKKPEDFVLSTGRTTTVRKFVEMAFLEVGIQIRWQGTGLEEKGVGPDDKVLVEISPQFFRPTEVDLLIGDSTRARNQLGWTPKTSVEQLVQMMIRADQKALSEMSLAHQ